MRFRRVEPDKPVEFWHEAKVADRTDLRRHAIRWSAVFAILLGTMFFVLWRSSSAVHYGSSRVEANTAATYRVTGEVVDSSGRPIPWARIEDDPSGRPPFFDTTADRNGRFELLTLAEPHTLVIRALGFRPGRVAVGKNWYLWMPSGAETVRITLAPE